MHDGGAHRRVNAGDGYVGSARQARTYLAGRHKRREHQRPSVVRPKDKWCGRHARGFALVRVRRVAQSARLRAHVAHPPALAWRFTQVQLLRQVATDIEAVDAAAAAALRGRDGYAKPAGGCFDEGRTHAAAFLHARRWVVLEGEHNIFERGTRS
eukprot:364225-Chlamydomonas_euryale.AAC.2